MFFLKWEIYNSCQIWEVSTQKHSSHLKAYSEPKLEFPCPGEQEDKPPQVPGSHVKASS